MRNARLLAALALTSAPVLAGDVIIRVEGSVASVNAAPIFGPFTAVAPGQPVTLRVEVFEPGFVVAPVQYVNYMIDGPASSLTIGNSVDSLDFSSLWLKNDAPVSDGLRMYQEALATYMGRITFEVWEPTGTMFGSTDITRGLGTWPASAFSAYDFLLVGNGGHVELELDRVTIELPGVGASYCGPASTNSTHAPATIHAHGSEVLSDNRVRLSAVALPAHSFGYFLCSETQAAVPAAGGSQGTLCLGGTIGRFAAQVQNSGAAGAFSLAIDLAALPQPNGAQAAQVGETWRFQAWYRDANPGVTSNFSNGVALTLR